MRGGEAAARDLLRDAENLRSRFRFSDALKVLAKAGRLAARSGDLSGVLEARIATADLLRMVGRFSKARDSYHEALDLCDALGERVLKADVLVGMGLALRATGQWGQGLVHIRKGRRLYDREKDRRGIAFSLWAEAGALRVGGLITKALDRFEEARSLFAFARYRSGVAYSLCGLGGSSRVAGRYRESLSYYRRANALFSRLKDVFGEAYSHCGIGNALRMMGDERGALTHFRKAVVLYRQIGDIVSYSYTLWSIANVYKMRKRGDKARQYLAEAAQNFRRTGDPRGLAYCQLSIGEIEAIEGKWRSAEGRFRSALETAERCALGLERCYALMLLRICRQAQGRASGPEPACRRKVAAPLDFGSFPVLMP